MTKTQTQMQALIAEKKPDKRWQDRRSVQLTISRALYRRLRQRARAERLPFASWLVRLALRELRRKPSL